MLDSQIHDAEVCPSFLPWTHSYGCTTVCQMTASKAAKAEFAKEYDQAFRLYIKAAESFLHLSRQSDKTKQQCKANASKALERAERIKLFVEKSLSNQSPSLRLTPVPINHFSPRKSFISLPFPVFTSTGRGTTIHFEERSKCQRPQLFFVGWSSSILVLFTLYVSLLLSFNLVPSQRHSSDPDGQPKLSPDQQINSCFWKRPNQTPGQSVDILRRRILPEDILQHIVTDCSVCASISVCLEHSRRFGSTVSGSFFLFNYSCLDIFHSLQYHPYRLLKWMADMTFGFCLMVHIVEWVLSSSAKKITLTPESF